MLEDLIRELIGAVRANTAALLEPDLSEKNAKPVAKVSKKKTAKKTAAKVEPAAAATAQTEVVDPAQPLDAAKVQTHLRGIASQLTDTSKLFALIQKHGGQQFSDLDPSVYEQLIADAEQLVADGA